MFLGGFTSTLLVQSVALEFPKSLSRRKPEVPVINEATRMASLEALVVSRLHSVLLSPLFLPPCLLH
jgi:exopolysaccharide biosynthesis predicted pyruvyltransferase EpsI